MCQTKWQADTQAVGQLSGVLAVRDRRRRHQHRAERRQPDHRRRSSGTTGPGRPRPPAAATACCSASRPTRTRSRPAPTGRPPTSRCWPTLRPGYEIFCTAKPQPCSAGHGWLFIGGTSAGTPLLAGGVALADQALRQAGRSGLGFVNPLLYSIASSNAALAAPPTATSVFSDVTLRLQRSVRDAPQAARLLHRDPGLRRCLGARPAQRREPDRDGEDA